MSSVQGWAVVGPDGTIYKAVTGKSTAIDSAKRNNSLFEEGHTVKPVTIATGCKWVEELDILNEPVWNTECGIAWTFLESGPEYNEVNFCPNCGGKVVVSGSAGGRR